MNLHRSTQYCCLTSTSCTKCWRFHHYYEQPNHTGVPVTTTNNQLQNQNFYCEFSSCRSRQLCVRLCHFCHSSVTSSHMCCIVIEFEEFSPPTHLGTGQGVPTDLGSQRTKAVRDLPVIWEFGELRQLESFHWPGKWENWGSQGGLGIFLDVWWKMMQHLICVWLYILKWMKMILKWKIKRNTKNRKCLRNVYRMHVLIERTMERSWCREKGERAD